jgi:hypothetical protein
MSLTINAPKLSPSLGEYDEAVLVDPNNNQIPLVALVHPSAVDGSNETNGLTVIPGVVSQVTGKRGKPMVAVGGVNIPILAAMNIGAGPALSKAGGKFQSTERTATGSLENIAHGLGVVPSLVLVSIQNTNGVALPFSIVEGAHDATNLKVTVTTNLMYKVIAIA